MTVTISTRLEDGSITTTFAATEEQLTLNHNARQATTLINGAMQKKQRKNLKKSLITEVGICLRFVINDISFLLVSAGLEEVCSVTAGKIDNPQTPLAMQVALELHKVTFGIFQLVNKQGTFSLLCGKNKKHYPLSLRGIHVVDDYQFNSSACLTFDYDVDGFSLEELNNLAKEMTPTATFWNDYYQIIKIELPPPPEDDPQMHWLATSMFERENALNQALELYLSRDPKTPLQVGPKEVFGGFFDEEAIRRSFNLPSSVNDLYETLNLKLGDYSNHSSWHIVPEAVMQRALTAKTPVTDIHGQALATQIFDSLHVGAVFTRHALAVQQSSDLFLLLQKGKLIVILEGDGTIFAREQPMRLLPGAKRFLQESNQKGNIIAICSNHDAAAVAEAISFQGVRCLLPDGKSPQVIQHFKALLGLGVVTPSDLNKFLTNSDFRHQLKSHPNYLKTVYIGGDVKDYGAAVQSDFDYFIASTHSGTCDYSQFCAQIASTKSATQVILVDNLEMLRTLTLTQQGVTKEGFFARPQSVSTPAPAQFVISAKL